MAIVHIPEIWPVKVIDLKEFKEIYPNKEKANMDGVKNKITKRLKHIEGRINLLGKAHDNRLSVYARGFSTGKLHRLIGERYFLELLMEEISKN